MKEEIMADVKHMLQQVIQQAMTDMKQFISATFSSTFSHQNDSLPHDTNATREPRRSHPYTRPARTTTPALTSEAVSTNHGQQT